MSEKIIGIFRNRLMDMRMEVNKIIDQELKKLDEDSVQVAKVGNGKKVGTISETGELEDEVIPMEVIISREGSGGAGGTGPGMAGEAR